MSSEEEQKAFEEEVAASTVPQQVGDVKLEDLPGPEVLQEPGKVLTKPRWLITDGDGYYEIYNLINLLQNLQTGRIFFMNI